MSTQTTQSTIKRYIAIAKAVGCYNRCAASGNTEWEAKHRDAIETLCGGLPSGSGFDNGSHIELGQSTGEKLVFSTSFHHMNNNGMYDGWTEHEVILTPSLEMGYSLRVTGKDRNDIKDYIAEQFGYVLDADVKQWDGYPIKETVAA
jgi:hypothetical protein